VPLRQTRLCIGEHRGPADVIASPVGNPALTSMPGLHRVTDRPLRAIEHHLTARPEVVSSA
jgi:hypothetical protein